MGHISGPPQTGGKVVPDVSMLKEYTIGLDWEAVDSKSYLKNT